MLIKWIIYSRYATIPLNSILEAESLTKANKVEAGVKKVLSF